MCLPLILLQSLDLARKMCFSYLFSFIPQINKIDKPIRHTTNENNYVKEFKHLYMIIFYLKVRQEIVLIESYKIIPL